MVSIQSCSTKQMKGWVAIVGKQCITNEEDYVLVVKLGMKSGKEVGEDNASQRGADCNKHDCGS
jgi:hypothetical protein